MINEKPIFGITRRQFEETLPDEDLREVKWLSYSSAKEIHRCRRRFFWHKKLGLTKPFSVDAMKYGAAIHYALPHAQRGDIAMAMAAFQEAWAGGIEDSKRNTSRAKALLMDFMRSHSPAIYKLIPPPGTFESSDPVSDDEVPFAIDLGFDIPIVGRVDALADWPNRGLWAVEYKTSSSLGTTFLESFEFEPQALTYALALVTQGIEVEGVIIEGLGVMKSSTKSLTAPIRVSNHELSSVVDWYGEAIKKLQDCERDNYWPKDLSGCTAYTSFGCPWYSCEYRYLCKAGKDWPEMVGLYETEEPNPFVVSPRNSDNSSTGEPSQENHTPVSETKPAENI